MATMQKTFECFTCRQSVKLERKADNSGWIKTNLDGSPHVDQKKQSFPSSKTAENLAKLEAKIDQLIKEVSALRTELKKQ